MYLDVGTRFASSCHRTKWYTLTSDLIIAKEKLLGQNAQPATKCGHQPERLKDRLFRVSSQDFTIQIFRRPSLLI